MHDTAPVEHDDGPLARLIVAGLLVGALAAGAWSWVANSASDRDPVGTGAAVGLPADHNGAWSRIGWDPIRPWQRSVVRITTDRCGEEIRGSGVVVGGRVLANAHVVAGASSVVVTTADGAAQTVTAVAVSDRIDLAVLDAADLDAGLALSVEDPDPGSTLSMGGFPAGHHFVSRAVEVDGVVRGWQFPDPRRALHLDVDVATGESGSAIVDEHGAVAALLYARSTVDTQGLAIGASEIRSARNDLASQAFVSC